MPSSKEDSKEESTAPNEKICGACGNFFPQTSFSAKQWKIRTWRRRCKDCTTSEIPLQNNDPSIIKKRKEEGEEEEEAASADKTLYNNNNSSNNNGQHDGPPRLIHDGEKNCTSSNSTSIVFTPAGPNSDVEPRKTSEILGVLNEDSYPKKETVEELWHALQHEIQSESHQAIVSQLEIASQESPETIMSNLSLNNDYNDDSYDLPPPATYETPEMRTFQKTPLLFGTSHYIPFKLLKVDQPENTVRVIRDRQLGHKDLKVTWKANTFLKLEFALPQGPIGKWGRGSCVDFVCYLGECRLTPKDLWDLAVQFRPQSGSAASKYVWPEYYSVLQCPFCAKLASPSNPNDHYDAKYDDDDTEEEEFIMVAQMLMQTVKTNKRVNIVHRLLPRLCCKNCFVRNLQHCGFKWGFYPKGTTPFNLVNLLQGEDVCKDIPMGTTPDAYTLLSLFNDCGLCGTISQMIFEKGYLNYQTTTSKVRISKSLSKKNRNQQVLIMKNRREKQCYWCGIQLVSSLKCGNCQQVQYCSKECQSKHWSTHKKTCGKVDTVDPPMPSTKIVVKKKSEEKAYIRDRPICRACNKHAHDGGGNPCMCFACGEFIFCGSCFGRPENGGKNGYPIHVTSICQQCMPRERNRVTQGRVGSLLQTLLERNPTGHHVYNTRLILAQFMLNDTEDLTGIPQSIEKAKMEYMWLANNCDYAPAQFAMASFYDPMCIEGEENWDGPTMLHSLDIDRFPPPVSPFQPNANMARKYYKRACEQKLSIALGTVGTMFKNGGAIFPHDMNRGIEMLEEASNLGDACAMGNLARAYVRRNNYTDANKLFEQAADHGNYQAMFMMVQIGMQLTRWKSKGCKFMKKLCEDAWTPSDDLPQEAQFLFRQAFDFYDIDHEAYDYYYS